MEIHDGKVESVRAVVDCSEPFYMHRLDYNAKKAESDTERKFQIDAVSVVKMVFACLSLTAQYMYTWS
jgi:hypothetical protein